VLILTAAGALVVGALIAVLVTTQTRTPPREHELVRPLIRDDDQAEGRRLLREFYGES
jgi:hypothetical protein